MKRILLSIVSFAFAGALYAQDLVGTDPTNRVAIIEDYTGIGCTWCPAGAQIADQLKAAYPDQVLAIGVHSGGYAARSGVFPDLDFRTQYGTYLNGQAGPTFYPAGSVNRVPYGGDLAMSRTSWQAACQQIIAQASPVNVGIEANYNPGSDEITVNVELYYTSDVGASQWLHVAVLQDNVDAHQVGMSKYPARVQSNGLYRHMDNLRDYMTGYFGEEITTTNTTDFVSRTFTYDINNVPADGNGDPLVDPVIEDFKFIAFTTSGGTYSEIISAAEAHAMERPVGITETASLKGLNVYPNPFNSEATIEFNLEESQNIAVNVFDVTGKVVQSYPNTVYSMGNHKLNVDGSALKNGLYYVNIVSEDAVITRKLILEK